MMTLTELQSMPEEMLRRNIETQLTAMLTSARERRPVKAQLEAYIASGKLYIRHLRNLRSAMETDRAEAMSSSEESARQFKERASRLELAVERFETAAEACTQRLPEAETLADAAHESMRQALARQKTLKKHLQSYEHHAREIARIAEDAKAIIEDFRAQEELAGDLALLEDYRSGQDFRTMDATCKAGHRMLRDTALPDITQERQFHLLDAMFGIIPGIRG